MDASVVVDLVINAGGESRRMRRNKALLPVPPDDVPLVVHVMRRLMPLVTGQIVVVTSDPQVAATVHAAGAVKVVADQWAGGGALGGIATGLAHCDGWAMVVACDMPLVSRALYVHLLRLAGAAPTTHAIVPISGGQAQPFHALWHASAVPLLAAQLAAGVLAVQAALETLAVRWVDEHELGTRADDPAFINVNTPAEWEAACSLLATQTR